LANFLCKLAFAILLFSTKSLKVKRFFCGPSKKISSCNSEQRAQFGFWQKIIGE